MLALGIILVIVAIGGGGFVGYLSTQSSQTVTIGGTTGITLGVLPITLFAAGAASVLLLWLGFRLSALGFRHKRAQRRELKERRREVKELKASGATVPRESGPGTVERGTTRPTDGTTGTGGAGRTTP